jgi:hypothetical protein
MTTLNVALSSKLQTTLGNKGVDAYAVYFDANGAAQWTKMVSNGTVKDKGTVSIDLPAQLNGGKIYFLIQSQDPNGTQSDLTSLITQQSQINWNTAAQYQFRYDSFEVTLLGQSGDVGNLTSVEGFGIPMEIKVPYANGTTATRGYETSGSSLFWNLKSANGQSLSTFTDGPLAGTYRSVTSPAQSVTLPSGSQPYTASSWNGYIDTLKTAAPGVTVSGFFNGAKDSNGVYHEAGFFGYSLEWVAGADGKPGFFWLNPTATSQIKGHIKITADALANSIYSTLGNVEIYASKTDTTAYTILNSGSTEMNTGANTQWGEVLTQFLTGFTAGYYGTAGQSLNPFVSQTINLSQNWNWDPSYAFGQSLSGKAAPFHDYYSQVFFNMSNSYGSGYSDNLMDAYAQGGPLISVAEQVNGVWKNVKNIDLKLFDDSEIPNGYVTPVIYNYIAPIGEFDYGTKQFFQGSYNIPKWQTVNPCTVTLNFFNQNAILKDDTLITLRIFDGTVNGEPYFQALTLNGAGNGGLWQNWAISQNATTGTYVINAIPNTPQTAGALVISSLPTVQDGIGWYQIVVGSGAAAKTFNLYTTTKGGLFLNPAISNQAGSLAVDGLANVSPQTATSSTIQTFAVDFLYSGSTTLSPDLLTWNTNPLHVSQQPQATAPVAGTLVAGVFTALSGQGNLASNSATSTSAELAFGWTGTNSAAGTASWISGTTNKVSAGNLAAISVRQGGQDVLAPVYATGDLDGMWQTSTALALGNGTYTVTVTEMLAAGSGIGAAISPASNTLTLKVDVDEAPILANTAGNGVKIDLTSAPNAQASWVKFAVQSESVDTGLSILVYAVDAKGNYVNRAGVSGASVSFDDAIRGTVGASTDDAGNSLVLGSQSVLLRPGEELRFAVLSGNDVVTLHPGATVTGASGSPLTVSVGGLTLSATANNDLSSNALMASAQRNTDLPLMYLDQGQKLNLTLTGSTSLTNQLAFVRVDMDLSGKISLNGVSMTEASAFRSEVAKSLDGGGSFTFQGSDTSPVSAVWTVAGKNGYYAPVLLTGTKEVFVLGVANSDGAEHIRLLGQNTFGFEDLTKAQGADFDFNDLVVGISAGSGSSANFVA